MKERNKWVGSRITALALTPLVALLLCGAEAAATAQQAAGSNQPAATSSQSMTSHSSSAAPLIDAPTPEIAEINVATGLPVQADGQSNSSSSSQSSAAQAQISKKPLGTAAAPPESTVGATASRPAGAVIAPAKQRRARAILIRVALLVGAGVALGTVLALTHATPSQPQ